MDKENKMVLYPEGAYCKVGNGWKRRIDMPELDDKQWYEFLAENGHTDYQYAHAANILTNGTNGNKGVEAYKWLFICQALGNKRATPALDFLSEGLLPTELDSGFQLAEEWFSEKFEEDLSRDPTGWSQELRKFVGMNI